MADLYYKITWYSWWSGIATENVWSVLTACMENEKEQILRVA